ncbi:MAG: HAMP domain-containing histidine kinase [Tissierellia bacterium]|nr:HAMP domain-containing histidine kinase [Tissierellia bacterium]
MMKKTIYKELITIFILVLLISNLLTALYVSLRFESTTIADMKKVLNFSIEEAKEIYNKYDISISDMNRIYSDKSIPILFLDNIDEYNLNQSQITILDSGNSILLNEEQFYKYPIAMTKTKDIYIVSNIEGNSMFNMARAIVSLNSTIAVLLGIIMFLFVAKMIVKPIKDLTDATKKVATGDFSLVIKTERDDELGELIDGFNKMTKDLASIEILRNDFISDISHEFKSPITSIEGYTKLLADSNDEAKDEYTDIILHETERLSNMATNILTINKLDNENIINTEEFKLDEQIRRSILLLENKWNEKAIELDVDLDDVIIKANKDLINQIWINLLDNAIKFSPLNGRISIKLINHEKRCEFIIEDEGIGISKEDQEKIFEKFYKADKSRNIEGTGLGLSIVKRIVDLHEGEIKLDSQVGRGTRISVFLSNQV